ncbi:MAG: hypothetical protein ACLGIK_08480 [Gemmatimonadota bacterium]
MNMVGDFYSEHRKSIDARKAHLARVGITPPDVSPARDAMPSQADALAMPTTTERPILDASHPALVPGAAPAEFAAPKLPKLPGVNATTDGQDA